jgi:hypothetical protein
MQVPKNFDDFDHDDPNVSFHKKRWQWWEALRKANKEFNSLQDDEFKFKELNSLEQAEFIKFDEWMKDAYGVKMHYDHDGNLTATYTVINEEKWLRFVLRYFTGESNG